MIKKIVLLFGAAFCLPCAFTIAFGSQSESLGAAYDARIHGRQILTPVAPLSPRITGADVFGVRPGKPILFHVPATGERPLVFSAKGLPDGVAIDPASGWITGRAPHVAGDIVVEVEARNAKGAAARQLMLRVGGTICLTPPMGWNSWYVQSEGVSDRAIRETAIALQEKGLTDHGWSYLNIDDCWMGLRDPQTKAIQPNAKFPDMKALVDFVHGKGLKVGVYSTTWMTTYAGYVGGSSPNAEGDYSKFFLPQNERQNSHQVFGRYPNGIRKGMAKIGPAWFVDRDARQFAEWGIDYVKYDWKEWTLKQGEKGYEEDKNKSVHKTEAVTKRFHDNFRALDRDIVLSLSPDHDSFEDGFVPRYCNLWRLTPDIRAEWQRIIAPFEMERRLQLTGPGRYGDLDMLQIGPLGKPNRAEVVFKPSPLTPAEQYFQVTLWAILTQPLLLSCHIPTMDAFDVNLVTNDEVLAVNQDRLCKQGYRVANREGSWEIWAKDLADGGKAVAMFNLSSEDQVIAVGAQQLSIAGTIRDLWRQKDVGAIKSRSDQFAVNVTSHGAAFFKVTPVRAVSAETMQHVYDEVKTPYKYGVVIKGESKEALVDCVSLFRSGGHWYMMYVTSENKVGYQTHLARSDDLLHWEKLGKILSFTKPGEWDAWQADGGVALCDYTWGGSAELGKFDGKYWLSYIGGAKQGYEPDPLSIGIAWTDAPTAAKEWNRLKENPVLGPHQPDVRPFEKVTLYKSQIIHDKTNTLGWPFVMFYNGKIKNSYEKIGMAVSRDMIHWTRYGKDAVVANGEDKQNGITGDPQIVRMGDVWVMFYFGAFWKPGAFDTFACSYDLVNWTKWEGLHIVESSEPFDQKYAHKPWVVKWNGIVYHFYCAVGDQGRVIALATSKDLRAKDTDNLPVALEPNMRVSACNNWRFASAADAISPAPAPDASEWREVTLPHDWSIEGIVDEKAPSRGGGGFFPTGIGWYRRDFDVPAEWSEKHVSLEFEGVYMNAEVWINGVSVAKQPYGYSSFFADLTQYLRPGKKNTVLVRVDNSAQPNCRWYSSSGIYRPVWLHVTDPIRIAPWGVFVSTTELATGVASLRVETSVLNGATSNADLTIENSIIDPEGREVAAAKTNGRANAGANFSASVTLSIANPRPWSPESPLLYRAVTRLLSGGRIVDETSTLFGVRTIHVSAERGFELNGQTIKLVGGNLHHDNGPLGAAAFARAEERKVQLLKAAGFNAVRTAHNPPSPAFLEACDRLGMLVMDEAFDGWKARKVAQDYSVHFDAWWRHDLDAMILRDRNHPSVVLWSIGNEMKERGNASGLRIASALSRRIRELDTSRPITAGVNGLDKGGEWKQLDSLFDTLDIAGYNYQLAAQHAGDHKRLPDRVIVSTESHLSDTFVNWAVTHENAYAVGDFAWSAMDYLGEAGIGRVYSPGEKIGRHWEGGQFPWHGAACGDIDLTGLRKPISHYRNIVWDRGEKLYAAVITPAPGGGKWGLSDWALEPLLPSWTWPGHEGEAMKVEVYSRYATVKLFLNEKLIDEKPVSRASEFKASFSVPYASGKLEAVAYESGREMERFALITAGPAARLRLTVDRSQLVADRQDLAYVTVEVIDKDGVCVPQGDASVRYMLDGPATIAGIGSADLTTRESYQANPRRLYQGRALVVIRAGDHPGTVTLTATASGFAPAQTTILTTKSRHGVFGK